MKLGKLLLLSSLLAVFGVPFVQAQSVQVRAKIPFAFKVENWTLPAGQYDFTPQNNQEVIRVEGINKGPSAAVLVQTRLAAAIHTTPEDAHIVFDKVGNTYTLAELWTVGEDGYVLHVTKERHEHRVINVPK